MKILFRKWKLTVYYAFLIICTWILYNRVFNKDITKTIMSEKDNTFKNNSQVNTIAGKKDENFINTRTPISQLEKVKEIVDRIGHYESIKKSMFANLSNNGIPVSDPHNIAFLINEPQLCSNKSVDLLIYVHTSPGHTRRRDVIRQTWGNQLYYNGITRVLIFVMGWDVQTSKEVILKESEENHDVIQMDFMDTYFNLSYKGLSALRWINNHCQHTKYILKTDDDCVVNIFEVQRQFLLFKPFDVEVENRRHFIACRVLSKSSVIRSGKWAVRSKEYNDRRYPPYCIGLAYIMTGPAALDMYTASRDVSVLWVDDAYITGMLPLSAGNIAHVEIKPTKFIMGQIILMNVLNKQGRIMKYWFAHASDHELFDITWKELLTAHNGHKSELTVTFNIWGLFKEKPL